MARVRCVQVKGTEFPPFLHPLLSPHLNSSELDFSMIGLVCEYKRNLVFFTSLVRSCCTAATTLQSLQLRIKSEAMHGPMKKLQFSHLMRSKYSVYSIMEVVSITCLNLTRPTGNCRGFAVRSCVYLRFPPPPPPPPPLHCTNAPINLHLRRAVKDIDAAVFAVSNAHIDALERARDSSCNAVF